MINSEINWKQNLRVAWLGNFFTGASFSLVMPFMALYVEQLGAPQNKVEWYAGLAVSLSALTSALIAPVWGRLADRYWVVFLLKSWVFVKFFFWSVLFY